MAYRYDVDDLTDCARGLRALHADFEGASSSRRGAEAALGYASLRGAMEQFTEDWRHNRDRQLEEIAATAEALDGVVENYVTQDAEAAAELRG